MLELEIIFENENFLAVNKPAGLVVHAAKIAASKQREENEKDREPTLVDWLLKNRPEVRTVGDDPVQRPGIVHRLDKETSGIMLIPKTQEYFEYLKSLFKERKIKKTYLAVVRGVPKNKTGIIDAPIGIVNGTLKRSVRSKKMQKEAVTKYKVVREFLGEDGQPRSLLEIHPETGRTHQIRVHLASIGHPILGDKLYRGPQASRLMLHAEAITFPEKDGSSIHLSTESPFAKN